MRRTLTAGDVSTRYAYRWLRSAYRLTVTDVYLVATWDGDLPPATYEALDHLDGKCKTIGDRDRPGMWLGRTVAWHGLQRRGPRRRPHYRRYRYPADREVGMDYARRLSALLRTAARDGVALRVTEDQG